MEPYGTPINLGSIGYSGKSGMFVLGASQKAALDDAGLPLEYLTLKGFSEGMAKAEYRV